MNIADHFGAVCFATDVRVKIAGLPELQAIAFQLAGSDLLGRFQKLGYEDRWRLVDQQVDMLRHQHVGVNPGLMPCPGLFKNGFDRIFGFGCLKEGKPVKPTEGDEVESFRFLEPFQTIRHAVLVICGWGEDPLIAIGLR